MRPMKSPEDTLSNVALHCFATAKREAAVSMPPARYPEEAGLRQSQVKRESKPASKVLAGHEAVGLQGLTDSHR